MYQFKMILINELLDSEQIEEVIKDSSLASMFSFKETEFNNSIVNTIALEFDRAENLFYVKYGYKQRGHPFRKGTIEYFSPYDLVRLFKKLNLLIGLDEPIHIKTNSVEKICAVVCPNAPCDLAAAECYWKQKMAIQCERLVRESLVNHFILHLANRFALDIAEHLISLRERFSFVMLEFIEGYTGNWNSFESKNRFYKIFKAADRSIKNEDYFLPSAVKKGYQGNNESFIYEFFGLNCCDIALFSERKFFELIHFCKIKNKKINFIL